MLSYGALKLFPIWDPLRDVRTPAGVPLRDDDTAP